MENTINLKEEINRIGQETGFAPRLIEKDYHLTKILHKLSERKIDNLVFKGGTCLNKCYLGFYRLSEDLDFVFNQDFRELTKQQAKKLIDPIRRIVFEIFDQLGLESNTELGNGWRMLTSKEKNRILGFESVAKYASLLDGSMQSIKLEISFRNKLLKPTKTRPIHHEFVDALGKPILREDVEIEVIDLQENLAEKFRALITRKNIAVRDIYDIYFIFKEKVLPFSIETLNLAVSKIRETLGDSFKTEDLVSFIEQLDAKLDSLNEKELLAVLKSGQAVNIPEMTRVIKREVLATQIN